jgi:hypothetical protein
MRPEVFVGSSSESLAIAEAAQLNLQADADVTVWTQGMFTLSQSTMDGLIQRASKSDFAVFVFGRDDVTRMRGRDYVTARDNVVFETGLFAGSLGMSRTFILRPRGGDELRLPSDLLGITTAAYDSDRPDGNLTAALGPACTQIRTAMRRLGPVFRPVLFRDGDLEGYRGPNLSGSWRSYDLPEDLEAEPPHDPVGAAEIDQWGCRVRMRLTRHRSRTGRAISRTFEYSGHVESGQLTLLFEDIGMRGFVSGTMVLKLPANGRRLVGRTVYLDQDAGVVVSHGVALERTVGTE